MKRNICAVCLDETRFYNLDPDDAPLIERILGVYIVDRSSRTFCCEITPSYDLRHIYDVVIPTSDCSDDDRERLDLTYGYLGGEDIYVHCRVIDALPSDRIRVWGDDPDAETDEEAMGSAREAFQGNCPW